LDSVFTKNTACSHDVSGGTAARVEIRVSPAWAHDFFTARIEVKSVVNDVLLET
jgi:hypothetical protein